MTSSATGGAGVGAIASLGETEAPSSPPLMCLPSLGLPQIDVTPLQSSCDGYDASASSPHLLPSEAPGLSADASREPASVGVDGPRFGVSAVGSTPSPPAVAAVLAAGSTPAVAASASSAPTGGGGDASIAGSAGGPASVVGVIGMGHARST